MSEARRFDHVAMGYLFPVFTNTQEHPRRDNDDPGAGNPLIENTSLRLPAGYLPPASNDSPA